ncbi:MAG: hypothetical protein RLY78_2019 [Pseudomonadota bacterium]|jgi:pimeloyl-ACP methyl ester carboxylesterase
MQLRANGIRIEVDEQGPPDGPVLLLIMGLGMQLIGWPQPLVDRLCAAGVRVLRLDNRDAGLSQGFDEAGVPSLWRAGLRQQLHLPLRGLPYGLSDMAADVLGVLDALRIPRVHVCGASMGGMIAQHLAATVPQRIASLVLLMSTRGARDLPQPSLGAQWTMLQRPRRNDEAAVLPYLMRVHRAIGSQPPWRIDEAALLERQREAFRRAWRPDGTVRQLLAVAADGDRAPLLRRIAAQPWPQHVIHGAADPLLPPAHGRDLVRHLPRAAFSLIEGMGHDLPPALLPRLAAELLETMAAGGAPIIAG